MTGAAGFVGQHVTQLLLADGWAVTGASAALPGGGALSPAERDAVDWRTLDLRDGDRIGPLLDAVRPDAIVHLAGIAHLVTAAGDPALTRAVNTGICERLLGELRPRRAAGDIDPVVLVVGSAEQYGPHDPAEMPLREEAEQRPVSVYAQAKAEQEALALAAHRDHGALVVCTRSFNHGGPGQHGDFLLPSLVRRVRALKAAGARELPLGNTAPVRDFLHVRDVARAYVALLGGGAGGTVYNVASGIGRDIGAIARSVCAAAGLDAELVTDAALVRPVEVPALVGDASRLRTATGWAPALSFDDLIADVMHAAT